MLVTLRDATDYITSLPKEEIRPRRLAGCDRGIDVGFAKWSHDDGADRGHEGESNSRHRAMYVNIIKQIGDQAGTDSFACNVLLRASETTAGVRLKPICGARERIQKSFLCKRATGLF